ncbi:MAG: hypothetical protein A3G33_10080 [Omnitrophica bacterium RIFCSPLOWO2_12_FULL_44_17]|uniref:Lipopolysaccharide heptosyltransferase II n=1 Tax=Candidatus Danuiimicrobium aquiferis TaxID=1801832 RepID=A0A1G1L1Y7_9BACT|nr:MAG: hypothetical protein A3B72_08530 [Omnitrophica bacterium RIFCSPHIGHO2_02_FULL_45_28]OGW91298.1 MAG: hypothetical protein A3E74_10045 [Omnitrophica bacterium RIFCSPHIGHO2_12_FULL_44_12]OGW99170.1 MAG: hypothetical protein A3G33_10080 [Omnitrophica bacterium RIFCSPLOWO2_12_FULL_44_17]
MNNIKPRKIWNRVLIVHPFGIGDVLFITPVIRSLKEQGVQKIDLLLGSRTREIFKYHPDVNEMFEWSKDRPKTIKARLERWASLLKMFFCIWRNRYEAMLDFSLSREYAFLGKFVFGIPVRAGFDFKQRGIFLSHKISLSEGFNGKPVAEYYLELLESLGIKKEKSRLEFFLGQEDLEEKNKIFKQNGIAEDESYLVVAPGGGESWGKDAHLKRWPLEHFAALICQMSREYGSLFQSVVILGSKSENELGKELKGLLSGFRVFNFCGQIPIRASAAIMKHAKLVLANDGGIVHLASALKVPVVAIYGPVDHNVYGPYPKNPLSLAIYHPSLSCRPCYRKMRYQSGCCSVECLKSLSPEYVFSVIKSEKLIGQLLGDRKAGKV